MVRLSESEQSELWDRWEAGESQRAIARALDRSPATIRTRLLSSGWRRPVDGAPMIGPVVMGGSVGVRGRIGQRTRRG